MTKDWKALAQEAWNAPSWKTAAAEYRLDRAGRPLIVEIEPHRLMRLRRLLDDDVSLQRAWDELNDPRNRPTPDIVVEALMLGLRERGTKALTERKVLQRLSDLSEQQVHDVCERLQRLKPEIARAWTTEQITALLGAWNICHG